MVKKIDNTDLTKESTLERLRKGYRATFKSADTEEWLDKVWTRPIGYLWALLFKKLHVHPNAVTVLSMILGASSALFFASGSYRYCGTHGLLMNIIAILLLAWANFLDSADGQLARMTNQKTRLGRILDGAASEVWFIPIYLALVFRFYHHHGDLFAWIGLTDNQTNTWILTGILFVMCLISGFVCHSGQCGLADYYRQIHLFVVNGTAGSELDTSEQQQQMYDNTPWKGNFLWKAFLKSYIGYTAKQERWTPKFQLMKRELMAKYPNPEDIPTELKQRFRKGSLPLVQLANILTFNTRAIALYVLCLLDLPWAYFIFEIVVMTALCIYMNRRHEHLCSEITKYLK